MGGEKFPTSDPCGLPISPKQSERDLEAFVKVTIQGQRLTIRLKPDHRTRIPPTYTPLTTTSTGLLYNKRGFQLKELQSSDSKKELLGKPKTIGENKTRKLEETEDSDTYINTKL